MDTDAVHLVIHLTQNPADTQLLQSQLDDELAGATVRGAGDESALRDLARPGRIELLVVDLPLPEESLDDVVAQLQAENPRLNVLFRWNTGGTWQYADGSEPLASIVRQTLRLGPARAQDEAQRKKTLDRIVRGQEVLLRLAQTDFWDFDQGLKKLTAAVARLMGVERVGVWEFEREDEHLRCLDLFELSCARHSARHELSDFPGYVKALSSSLMIAANDALQDPRTREFRNTYLVPHGITSMLDAPIRCRGRVRGVVCFEHVGPKRSWDTLEQCQAVSAANLLAQALETRDRRTLEQRLRESERLGAIGRTASRLAHDFNNRLSVIRAQIEVAQADVPDSRALGEALQELDKSLVITRNLMNLDRTSAAEPAPLDLAPVLRRLRPALEALTGNRITLEIDVDARPLIVAIAAADFEQVVLNLCTNARDALKRGGRLRVVLSASEGERARLLVEDNGIGMSATVRARLFEPFFSTKPDSRGSGLGLASVLAVVQEAHGDVMVDSQPGSGTQVVVELPLVRA